MSDHEVAPGEQSTVVTRDTPLDPSAIMELATGYWGSAALLAANELGLFGALASGARSAEEVARDLRVSLRGARMLLDACCGLNLVAKQGDHYMLPSVSLAFLVPGQPGYLGNALRWARDQYAAWGRLDEAARAGGPVVDPVSHLGGSPEETERFVLAMHDRALGVARGVIRYLDLEGCATLLDVGGGPGTYAMLLAQKYPTLYTTVLDLPAVAAVARRLIAGQGLSERVGTVEGDGSFGDYGEDRYDAVLFSGVLHQMDSTVVRRMLAGAHRALTAGGRVIISDIMTDATGAQPVFATLFSLQMLLTTTTGGVFSAEECADWLAGAGFTGVEVARTPPPLPYTVLTARR